MSIRIIPYDSTVKSHYNNPFEKELPDYACMLDYDFSIFPKVRNYVEGTITSGVIDAGYKWEERELTLQFKITPKSGYNIKQTIRLFQQDFLSLLLQQALVVFDEEPSIGYKVRLQDSTNVRFTKTYADITVNLLASMPFGISLGGYKTDYWKQTSTPNRLAVVNNGDILTYPIIEATLSSGYTTASFTVSNETTGESIVFRDSISPTVDTTWEYNMRTNRVTNLTTSTDYTTNIRYNSKYFGLEAGNNDIYCNQQQAYLQLYWFELYYM